MSKQTQGFAAAMRELGIGALLTCGGIWLNIYASHLLEMEDQPFLSDAFLMLCLFPVAVYADYTRASPKRNIWVICLLWMAYSVLAAGLVSLMAPNPIGKTLLSAIRLGCFAAAVGSAHLMHHWYARRAQNGYL
jgi:hypothetical protein